MDTKIKSFLQSDLLILSIALLLAFLCHFFVATEIVVSGKREKDAKTLYASAFDLKPLIGKKLQSIEYKDNEDFKLSALLESSLNISMREDDNYKYVDIETNDEDNKSLKIDINDNLINIQKQIENSKTIEKENEKISSSMVSRFSRSLTVPIGVDHEKAEIIKPECVFRCNWPLIPVPTGHQFLQ